MQDLAAEITSRYAIVHPDFSTLAGRLVVSKMHKSITKAFSECMERLYLEGKVYSIVWKAGEVLTDPF